MSVEFTQRLRELDAQVEGLRAALADLQRRLAVQQHRARDVTLAAPPGERDEYLRAYA